MAESASSDRKVDVPGGNAESDGSANRKSPANVSSQNYGEDFDVMKLYPSIGEETAEPINAVVTGTIPGWLKGSLMRNGPGKFQIGEESVDHLFDGLAFLHRFIIHEGGKVQYQGRFLQSDIYKKAEKYQRLVFDGFGTVARHPDPCKTIFQRMFSFFKPEYNDNCNVNVLKVGDDFYAMTETPLIKKIDPESLDVLDENDKELLLGVHTATAHPHTARDGTIYNMGTAMQMTCRYTIIQVPPRTDGGDPWQHASVLGSVPASSYNPAYYHSFAITENYIVFVEQPLYINVMKILLGKLTRTPPTHCMEYYPNSPTRFHVLRRADGRELPTRYTADAFFCFHHINAYESDDGDHVVVDMSCYDDESVLKRAQFENIKRDGITPVDAYPRRFVLPLENPDDTLQAKAARSGGQLVSLPDSQASATLRPDGSIHCSYESLSEYGIELPGISYAAYNGRDYRYAYGIGSADSLNKVDVKTRQTVRWTSPGCFPSEPVFVPAPTKAAEDDGVILSCVNDLESDDKPPFLLVLDAHSFTELARAQIPVSSRTFGFHGIFVGDA